MESPFTLDKNYHEVKHAGDKSLLMPRLRYVMIEIEIRV